MTSTTQNSVNIDNPSELKTIDIFPEGLDDQDLPYGSEELQNSLSSHTALALVQLELVASGWETVKVGQIRASHAQKHDLGTYRTTLLELADMGYLSHRKVRGIHEFRLPDECEPAAVFTDDDIEFVTSETDHGKFGSIPILTDVLPEWFDNQYVSVGEGILAVVVVNLVLLLLTGTFGPISESEPRVIFAWALLSFAISALLVGSLLLVFRRLQTRFT